MDKGHRDEANMKIEEEFNSIDQAGSWAVVYHKIRQDTLLQHEYSVKDSKRPEFKGRNRYRDVSPYDHSRVKLTKHDLDYINASLIEYPDAGRSYILTQGPLPNTASHFWLMVWENNSKAILMLNRIIEKGQVKCHQYFPMGSINEDEDDLVFEDVGLKVTFVSEENANFFVVRALDLEDLETNEKKRVLQFHYITWPDFGVPESPKEFLHFLFAVRKAGVLETSVGPAVIHCSAGIGRSGTFCLVDTCLVLLELQRREESVRVCDILMEMRRYRMGLIQTADQLRFSYLAIIEGWRQLSPQGALPELNGAQAIDSQNGEIDGDFEAEEEELESICNISLKPPADVSTTARTQVANGNSSSAPLDTSLKETLPTNYSLNNGLPLDSEPSLNHDSITRPSQEVRRRNREERKKKTAEQVALMRRKQQDCEEWKIRRQKARPYLWGLSVAVLLGSYLLYHYYF